MKIKTQTIALLLTTIASLIALAFYYQHGLILEYNDAASHLNIARRVTDSLTPGLVQIGSIWLPLLHLLLLPLTTSYFLWQSGLAGSIVSMLSFVFSSLAVFKLTKLITRDKISSLIATLAFILNANMLYMQTTAMSESLLIATSTWAIYFLLKWNDEQRTSQLLFSAFFIFLSTITRYDGWFLLLTSTLLAFLVTFKKEGYKSAEGKIIIFSVLAGFGVILWLLYNQIIFGKVTYFMSSEFSAHGQQIVWEELGKLPSKGNLFLASWTYIKTVMHNSGLIAFLLSCFGLVTYIFTKRKSLTKFLVVTLLLSPLIFHIISLYVGHSIIWLPGIPPYDDSFFNIRYGLVMIPTTSILIGILSMKKKYLKVIITSFILLQFGLFYLNGAWQFSYNGIATLKDTVGGKQESDIKTAQWIRSHCSSGRILISSAGYSNVIFHSGLDLKHFVTEGTGDYWTSSLNKPSNYVNCIVSGGSSLDLIKIKMEGNKDFDQNYALAKSYGGMQIFIRN